MSAVRVRAGRGAAAGPEVRRFVPGAWGGAKVDLSPGSFRAPEGTSRALFRRAGLGGVGYRVLGRGAW